MRPGAIAGEPGSVTSTTSAASLLSSSAASSSARARLDRGLERLARLVGGAADGAALLRRELGDAAQQVRQLGLAAQEAHPHVLELGRARRLGDRRLPGGAQLADPLVHGAAILRLHSYRATVAAIAAFRDSDAHRDRARRSSHAATTSAGRPSRSAPTTSVDVAVRRSRAARRRARRARSCGRGSSSAVAHARDRHVEQRAHRRPHGLRPVRVGGARPERDAARAERQRAAQRGADVAGVVDAPQRQAQRPDRRRRPALRVHADRARARPELARPGRAGAARPPRRRARTPRRPAARSAPSRPRRRRPADPRPRRRTRAACRATCGPRACGSP